MRVAIFGAGKQDTVSHPLVRITDRLQGSIQPFDGMGSHGFPVLEGSDPPIPDAVLAVAGLFVVGAAALGGNVSSRLSQGGFDAPSEQSVQAANALASRFHNGADNFILLVRARQIIALNIAHDVFDPSTGEKIGSIRSRGLKSIIRDVWDILDVNDQPIGLISEEVQNNT